MTARFITKTCYEFRKAPTLRRLIGAVRIHNQKYLLALKEENAYVYPVRKPTLSFVSAINHI